MIEANDILSRKSEIKGYVATAKLDLAVKRCIDFYRDFKVDDDDEAVLLSTSLYLVIEEEKKGIIEPKDAKFEKQKIASRILLIIKGFSNLELQA